MHSAKEGFLYPLCEAYVNNLKWWKKVFSTTIGTARSSQNLCKWELSHKLYFRFPQGPDLDVIVTQEVLNSKIKQAISIYGHIDVLVNNAGYVQAGLLEAVS
jgi:NADP-dependent 3-hydroxy acid dehydrogenase YdfG